MAYFQFNDFDVTNVGRTVNIPDNNVARLMYYLDVVCDLIEYDDRDLNRLRDYRNYHRITDTELRLLFIACAALDPDLLIDKVMFEDKNRNLTGTSQNRIYELGAIRHNLLVVNSILVAGRNRRVKKVMFYKPSWLTNFYIRPMAALTVIFEQERRRDAINNLVDNCTIS